MSILSKLTKSGLAAKAIQEARKPQNQAKIKQAVAKVQEQRRRRGTGR